MATNTTNYGFKKPDESDFYDVADQNKNWDLADEALKNLDTPTFEDYTGSTAVPSATDAIDQIKSKGKLGTLLSNIKAAFKGACLIGHIVNNCVTDNAGLPLSAAQGKVLKDLYTQLYSEMGTILQYSHTSDAPFDFNDKNAKAGFHRLGTENSFKNAPSGVNPVYSNVLVVRNNAWDTLSMTIYLYTKGTNSSVVYKTGNTTDWANLSWSVYATKSDLVDAVTYNPMLMYDGSKTVAAFCQSVKSGTTAVVYVPSNYDTKTTGIPEKGACFITVYKSTTSGYGFFDALMSGGKHYYCTEDNGKTSGWT